VNLLQHDTLDADRWRRIESVLDLVLEAEPHEVPALLERHCAGHPELRREIEALLEADGRASRLMTMPAAAILGSFAEEPPPARIGRYDITGTLGRGGMGVVFDGVDAAVGRRVALKSLPPGFAHDPARLEGFLCEARLLAALQSPHLAALHGIAREGSERYLVLERIDGVTLAELFTAGSLPLAQALDIVAQVATALAEVHALGIVHRDLKPANIMITPGGLVKLLDLGLAESAARAGEAGREWARAGTPGWMSPEQISGAGQDARSDVFAWGAVAWQCLTGTAPFTGATIDERIDATLERMLDPAALPAAVPAPVRAAVLRALERDPALRPADGAAIVAVFAHGEAVPPAVAAPGAAPLIGRTRELALAEQLIARAPLVTLTGAAGFGKSRLARELAARFPGCWYADLAACVDRAALESAIAEAAGLRGVAGEELLSALAEAATPPTLLVLDGGDAAPEAVVLVAAIRTRVPALRVLAARRERFALEGEEILRLSPLALPDDETTTRTALAACDAVRLFESCARVAVPGFTLGDHDLPLVAAVCRRLEGVPLAIELAAARLRDQPLAALAAEQGTGGADTLVAAIHASLATLSEPERHFFRALSVFRGGWDLDTAAAVAWPEADRFDALDALAQLLERSLVTIARADRSEPRYRFLEPVREVALALAERAGETAALRERHRDAYLVTSERLAPTLTSGGAQARSLAWLEAEHENILAALAFDAPGEDSAQRALRLAGAVWWFWYVRGHFARGRSALASVLARPGAEAPTPARALALFAAGGLAKFQGDRAEGRRLSLEALALFEAQGDTLGIARACSHVALCDADEQRFDDAAGGFARAIAIFRERGDARRLSATLNNLGVLERLRDDFGAAWTYHDEALAHFRRAADRDGTVVTLVNLALAGDRLGRTSEAATHLAEALALVRDLRARRAGAAALEATAELLATRGADADAARALGTAAALRTAIRLPADPWWRRMTDACRACLVERLGDEASAREFAAGAEQSFDTACASAITALSRVPATSTHTTPTPGGTR
jgi:non-specific serine/threonine protein kinase